MRWYRRLVGVMLLAAVGLSVFAGPAAAWPWDDPDWWGYEVAQTIQDGCLTGRDWVMDMPTSLMGSGSVAFAPPIANLPATGAAGATIDLVGTGTAGAAAGGGGAALGSVAGMAGVAAVEFVGVGCFTISLHDWVFGDPDPVPPLVPSGVTIGDPVPCADLLPVSPPGVQAGDVCITVGYDGVSGLPDEYYAAAVLGNPAPPDLWWNDHGGIQPYWFMPSRLADGTVSGVDGLLFQTWGDYAPANARWFGQFQPDEAVLVLPCSSPEVGCGLAQELEGWPNLEPAVLFRRVISGFDDSSLVSPLAPSIQAEGRRYRMHARVECLAPGAPTSSVVESSSSVFTQLAGSVDDLVAPTCPAGTAPIDVEVRRQWAYGGSINPAVWVNDTGTDPSIDWAMDDDIRTNPTSLQCWVQGVTVCPMYDPDPSNPATPRELGGPGGVPVPKSGPTVGTETVPKIVEAALPPTDPRDAPTPTTSPSVTTTTSPPTTLAPPVDPPDPCVGAWCVGGPQGPPPGGDGAECWPAGWGWFNPVEWVLRPVKCALLWAFWDQETADEIASVGTDKGWLDLASGFQTDPAAGPCIELDPGEICSSAVLGVELPESVHIVFTGVLMVVIVFECIGLFARATGSTG